jgi:uncharacterized protein YpmB
VYIPCIKKIPRMIMMIMIIIIIIIIINILKITQTMPEQHTGKARNQVTTENSHIWHCTHTAESANVHTYCGKC